VRSFLGGVLVVLVIAASLVARSGIVRAECDPAKADEPIASRFEVQGETAYDRRTDLTWMRCSYGQAWKEESGCTGEVKLLDWESAMRLRLPGDAAWRLPRKDELESIVATNCKRPAIDETVFPDTPSIQYWTGTPTGPSYAWVVFFRTGISTWNFLRTTPFAVRLVRPGK
jgi:hypothetical protein